MKRIDHRVKAFRIRPESLIIQTVNVRIKVIERLTAFVVESGI